MLSIFAPAIAAAHAAFGRDAVYVSPEGHASPAVRVIVSAASEDDAIGGARMIGDRQRVVEVMAVDVPRPAKGGRFEIAEGEAVIVAEPKAKDPEAMVWTCLCRLDS